MSDQELVKGCSFLLEPACSREFFTPEDFDQEMVSFAKTVEDFMLNEVLPRKEFDDQVAKLECNKELMAKAGELGVLMVDIPEQYGGLGLGILASMLVSEKIAVHPSFATTVMAHNGIGTLPLAFFGKHELKAKYLPKLATGEWIAAYALTEANFGSDALGAKTKAVLAGDGSHYVLSGEKVFITNAGFADLFTVYAKVDGEHFSSFLVERGFPGVSTSKEEEKMGIHGSSTRSLILEDVKVPLENALDEIGKGHKSALGILDIGRLKLGIASLGGCKRVLAVTIPYTKERKQFKTPICAFGMIRRKLADIATKTYALEGMSYRTAELFDKAVHGIPADDPNYANKAGDAFKEYDLEAAIMKVYGSEALAFAVDEGVQAHGGYGFITEYEVGRSYTDARINRIFEGTNEINRLTMLRTILMRTMKGEMDFMGPLNDILAEVKADAVPKTWSAEPMDRERVITDLARRMAIYTAGVVVQKHMAELTDPGFIFGKGEYYFEELANLIMEVYAMDSAVMRTRKLIAAKGADKVVFPQWCTQAFVFEAFQRVQAQALRCLTSVSGGDEAEFGRYQKALTRLTTTYPLDLMGLKDQIAEWLIKFERYFLG
jgi:alkylation response protein AidB-like acyl-CoA dehydrogenase